MTETDYIVEPLLVDSDPITRLKYVNIRPKSTLHFDTFFNHAQISLENCGERIVMFKVKTKMPKCYQVVPNTGYLQPNTKMIINVQKLENTDANNANQFLILVAEATKQDLKDRTNFWKDVTLAKCQTRKYKVEELEEKSISINKPRQLKHIIDTTTTNIKEASNMSEVKKKSLKFTAIVLFTTFICGTYLGIYLNDLWGLPVHPEHNEPTIIQEPCWLI